jgi:hypothetical protein
MPGRYRNRAAHSFYRGNLVLGQTQDDLRIGQIISPKIVLPILGLGFAPAIDQEPSIRQASIRQDNIRQDNIRQDNIRQASIRQASIRQDSIRPEIIRTRIPHACRAASP